MDRARLTKRRLALAALSLVSISCAAPDEGWRPIWNGKDLTGWETFLGAPEGETAPLGLDRDPRGVFSVVEIDGEPAIRISGEVYGALTTKESFERFQLRLQFKWGPKRWPPRESVGRDSGIFYNAIEPHGANGTPWMRAVQCNIMQKGCGQWWSVAGSICDVEAVTVGDWNRSRVPYRPESPGEQLLLYSPGAGWTTATAEVGVTPAVDPEKPFGEWNTAEVTSIGSTGIHVINGVKVLVVTNVRCPDGNRMIPLVRGRIQLESEAAEVYFRRIEVRPAPWSLGESAEAPD